MDSDFDTAVNTLDERLKDLSLDIRRMTVAVVAAILMRGSKSSWRDPNCGALNTAKQLVEEAEEWIVE